MPTGDYILKVESPGFASRSQVLRVYQPRVLRTATLPLGSLGFPLHPALTGKIINYSGDIKDLRVRLMALYGSELREGSVDRHGSFTFPVDEGTYLLVTVADLPAGMMILDTTPLRLRPEAGEVSVTVDLKNKHGTPVPLLN